MIAQDTGSAIKGPNRGDLFFAPDSTQAEKLGLQNFGVVNYFPSEISQASLATFPQILLLLIFLLRRKIVGVA